MKQFQNVSLKQHSTMRLGGTAKLVIEVTSREELREAIETAIAQGVEWIVIGGGSNIIWRDEGFDGMLIVNKIMGFEIQERDDENVYITTGAGEIWDSVVERSVAANLSGIEALSLIPGTAGATPVQNVGAYGQEISQVLLSVEAYDTKEKKFVFLSKYDCKFGYRDSIFKHEGRNRYAIAGVTFHLLKSRPEPPFYQALERYFADNNITDISPQTVRDAVVTIRRAKLPDPKEVANCGSFFANPIVDDSKLVQLKGKYPDIAYWELDGGLAAKIPAAWLLERAGFKNRYDEKTGMATWERQPLVLVNKSAKSTADLESFKESIVSKVQEMFGITLIQEPELLPYRTAVQNVTVTSSSTDSLEAILQQPPAPVGLTAEEQAIIDDIEKQAL